MYSDDAFISFRYAGRLAEGKGLTWNDGCRVEGFSNFLWVMVLAAARFVGLNVVLTAKILGALSGAATLVVLYLLTFLATKKAFLFVNLLAPFFHSLGIYSHFWMTSGMETSFFALLALLAVYLFAREELNGRRVPFSALAFFAAAVTRPEGVMLFAGASAYLAVSRASKIRELRFGIFSKRDSIWAAAFCILYAAFVLWRYSFFGQWLPNSYYAKLGGQGEFAAALSYISVFFFAHSFLFLLVPFGFFLSGGGARIAATAFSCGVTYVFGMLFMGRDWMDRWRIWCHILPLIFAAIAVGAAGAFNPVLQGARGPVLSWLIKIAFAAIIILGFIGQFAPPFEEIGEILAGRMREPKFAQEGDFTQKAAKEIGLLIARNAPPGALVAVNHAGAIPYYAKVDAIDMTGLSDLHIAHMPGGMHGKYDADYVLSRRPHFIVLNTHHAPLPDAIIPDHWAGETAVYNHPDFKANYIRVPGYWVVNWHYRPDNYNVLYRRKDVKMQGP